MWEPRLIHQSRMAIKRTLNSFTPPLVHTRARSCLSPYCLLATGHVTLSRRLPGQEAHEPPPSCSLRQLGRRHLPSACSGTLQGWQRGLDSTVHIHRGAVTSSKWPAPGRRHRREGHRGARLIGRFRPLADWKEIDLRRIKEWGTLSPQLSSWLVQMPSQKLPPPVPAH